MTSGMVCTLAMVSMSTNQIPGSCLHDREQEARCCLRQRSSSPHTYLAAA